MKIGTVTDVLKYMLGTAERAFSDPTRSLSTHLGKGRRFAVHPLRHVMAADAGKRPRTLRHQRRCIVGAPGAEIGNPPHRSLFEARLFRAGPKTLKRHG